MRIYTDPVLVGRKPRRAEDVVNSFEADRAGFEPRRGGGYTHESGRTQTLDSGQPSIAAVPTARLKSGADFPLADSSTLGAPRPDAASLWRGPATYRVTSEGWPRRKLCEVGFSPHQRGCQKSATVHARSVI
jgi:hypothetical protein